MQLFHGRLVARTMPKGLSQKLISVGNNCLDAIILQPPGVDELSYQPQVPRITSPEALAQSASLKGPLASTSEAVDDTPANNMELWETTLTIYLYRTNINSDTPLVDFTMNRDANESVEKTLQRVGLSFGKKLTGKKKKQRGATASVSASLHQVSPDCSALVPLDDYNHSLIGPETRNCEFWNQALCTPFALQLCRTYQGTEQRWNLLVEAFPPTVLSVQTFADFNACLYPQVPLVVNVDTLYSDGCRVDWYLDQNLFLADSNSFTPEFEHIGKRVAILVTPYRTATTTDGHHHHHDGTGCQKAHQFSKVVQALPDNTVLGLRRPTWTAKRRLFSSGESDRPLRIMTYNILADQNAFDYSVSGQVTRFFAEYVTPETIGKERRMPLVLHEILQYQADLVCLQEVDDHIFRSLFLPVLRENGYDGFFSKKLNAGNREGSAMFWSTHRFQEVAPGEKQCHQLRKLFTFDFDPNEEEWKDRNVIANLMEKREDLKCTLREKLGHVLQTVPLVDRITGRKIWAANTHLFYHHDASHIRLLQIYICCWKLHQLVKEDPGSSVVFCGDFNSSLNSSPGMLLRDRTVRQNSRRLKYCLNTFAYGGEKITGFDDDFPCISLPESFPRLNPGLSEAPAFTNLVGVPDKRFCDTLDHILISEDLAPLTSAPMPSMADAEKNVAMPSENFPSDHVSLVCDVNYR